MKCDIHPTLLAHNIVSKSTKILRIIIQLEEIDNSNRRGNTRVQSYHDTSLTESEYCAGLMISKRYLYNSIDIVLVMVLELLS